MAKLVNLTPHAINFVGEDGTPVLTVNPSGQIARVTAKTAVIGEVNGIPITVTEYSEIEGLPDPEENDEAIYIVSSLVASRVSDRWDVFIPNESVRDSQGRIVGCKSLGHI